MKKYFIEYWGDEELFNIALSHFRQKYIEEDKIMPFISFDKDRNFIYSYSSGFLATAKLSDSTIPIRRWFEEIKIEKQKPLQPKFLSYNYLFKNWEYPRTISPSTISYWKNKFIEEDSIDWFDIIETKDCSKLRGEERVVFAWNIDSLFEADQDLRFLFKIIRIKEEKVMTTTETLSVAKTGPWEEQEKIPTTEYKPIPEEKKEEIKKEPEYIKPDIEKTIKFCIESKYPLLLIWPPGCWKNTILSKALNWEEITIISLSGDVTKESLLGHYVLEWESTVWQDWPLASALKKWHKIILDEANLCHADIFAVLNNLLQLKEDWSLGDIFIADNWGEKIVPHPDARIFATANPVEGNAWTKEFNQATLSRFIVVEIDYLSRSNEIALLQEKFPEVESQTIEGIVDIANKLRGLKEQKKISIDVSTRHLVKVLALINSGLNYNFALKTWILNDAQYQEDKKEILQIIE